MTKSHALDIEFELFARMKPIEIGDETADYPIEVSIATGSVPVYFGASGEPDANGNVHVPVTVDTSVFERMGALLDGRL